MGRRSTISDARVFAAVSAQIANGDAFKIQTLADQTGISVGSLYHRYGSREGVMAAAWLDAMVSFQQGFLTALSGGDIAAGEAAALATPAFARQHCDQAILLCLGRRETLLHENAPAEIAAEAQRHNARAEAALAGFARQTGLKLTACLHGIVAFPLASVRLYLPHKDLPAEVDTYVRAAYRAVIAA